MSSLITIFVAFVIIARTECQPSSTICCLANSVISPCFKWCAENTCEHLLSPPKNCTAECESNVCVCADGLFRDECNQCVKKEQCYTPCKRYTPPICPAPNEVINGCFDPATAKVCSNVQCSTPRDIFLKFISPSQPGLCALSVCDCKDGYLRNKCNQCVLAEDCDKKCCVRKSDPCSQPNEVRVAKYRKRRPSSRRSKRKCSPFSYKRNRREERYSKTTSCVCENGLVRDKCNQCLPPDQLERKGACLCTDPCVQSGIAGLEWQCLNNCGARYCFNYYEMEVFKNKTCPDECVYVCDCSARLNLWYNGTDCVPAEQCPSYKQSLALKEVEKAISLTQLAQITLGFKEYIYERFYNLLNRIKNG